MMEIPLKNNKHCLYLAQGHKYGAPNEDWTQYSVVIDLKPRLLIIIPNVSQKYLVLFGSGPKPEVQDT